MTKSTMSIINAMAISGKIGCLSEVVVSARCGFDPRVWCGDMAFRLFAQDELTQKAN